VVVGDVLRAIHSALCIHVTEEQIDDWIEQHPGRDRIVPVRNMFMTNRKRKKAYYTGMTRLALLNGKTRFAGLSESMMGCDIWVLHVV
jgi:hypothetical protein